LEATYLIIPSASVIIYWDYSTYVETTSIACVVLKKIGGLVNSLQYGSRVVFRQRQLSIISGAYQRAHFLEKIWKKRRKFI
jgi:hypothetical protein